MQRSVVILKDVLDQSLEEIAAMLDLTVNAGEGPPRAGTGPAQGHQRPSAGSIRAAPAIACSSPLCRPVQSARLGRIARDAGRRRKAGQSTYPLRAGAANVAMFFGIYSSSAPVRLAAAWLDGPRGYCGLRRISRRRSPAI